MPRNVVGATKLRMQLQSEPIGYTNEMKLVKLKQNNCWNFIKGSRRGRLEIMAEILRYCEKQKAKTRIMYKSNLNYAQLKRHLRSLTSQGLLTTNKNKYATTQKGHRFLELFVQLSEILNC